MIETVLGKKSSRILLVATAAVLAVVLFAGILICCYFDALTGFAFGDGVAGVRIRNVSVLVDDREHQVSAYRSLGKMNAVFLVGAPSSSPEEDKCNLLVDDGRIARFNDSGRLFMTTPLFVIAGETVRHPYHLDDDMKGWGTRCLIGEEGDCLVFDILPAPPHHPKSIHLRIPMKYLRPASESSR